MGQYLSNPPHAQSMFDSIVSAMVSMVNKTSAQNDAGYLTRLSKVASQAYMAHPQWRSRNMKMRAAAIGDGINFHGTLLRKHLDTVCIH